jgi:hypothetical protein
MSGSSRDAYDEFSRGCAGIEDRRDWQRQIARDFKANLSWNQDDGPRKQEGHILNISGGGVAVLVDKVPPRGRVIRIQLQSLEKAHVDGRIVDAQPHRKSGRQLVRLRFIMECPAILFERAVHGQAPG